MEKILVVPTKKLYQKGQWNGFRQINLKWYRQLVNKYGVFKYRNEVENDPSFKQIIPQIVFTYQKKIFFHRIHTSGSESRLHNMYPIFLGGHVNSIDKRLDSDLLDVAAEREFFEEVKYKGKLIEKKFVGLVNKLEGIINQVHVGYIFIFWGDSDLIKSREKKICEIGMRSIGQLKPYFNQMTYWSQLVFPYVDKLIE